LLFNSSNFLLDDRGTEKDNLWKMLDQFYHQFTHQLLGHNRLSDFISFKRILERFSIRRYNGNYGADNSDYSTFHGVLFVLLVKHNFLRGFLHNQVIFKIQSNSLSFQFLAEDSYKFKPFFFQTPLISNKNDEENYVLAD
jgi:hypothetical protein